ncbi:hypothetical protein SUGI_0352330 [Cryptomeria japonica]|nr:hypothetical protein SUGI_0352330 [Cryptomeria japonica]
MAIMLEEKDELDALIYCNIAVAVLLSTGTGASMKGRAAMKYLQGFLFPWSKMFVVSPEAITIDLVSNGLVYTASTSSTSKKSSSFSAALKNKSICNTGEIAIFCNKI